MSSSGVRTAAVVAALALGALSAAMPVRARETGVNVGPGLEFKPKDKFIEVGDTIVWTHRDGDTPHTVESASSEQFDSSTNCPAVLPPGDCMTQGDTFTHRFDSVGDFRYRCELHEAQGMVGTIHVRSKPTATATATRTRSPPPPTRTSSPTPTGTGGGTLNPSAPPTGTATATSSTPGVAAPDDGGDTSRTPAVPIAVAALSLVVLGGAGYLVWRRFIAGA